MADAPFDPKKLQILLADDHAFIRNLIKGMLHQSGISNIHAADSGREALEVLQRRGSGIDCIISDWNMPPPGGLELLRHIRMGMMREISANLPFVMLSGHASSTVVTAALQLDVSAYVVKPASSAKLRDALHKAMSKQLTAKPAAFYRAIPEIEMPAEDEDPTEDPAAWAQWVKGGQQAILSNNAEFIARKPVELSTPPPPDDNQLHNVRFRPAEKIKPGAILAEDFCDAGGKPLISAGTVLSPKILEKIAAMSANGAGKIRLWVGTRER